MEIIDNKALLIRTKHPDRILQSIKKSKVVNQGEISEVAAHWDLDTAQALCKLKIKNVPSTIVRDYSWPGAYPPMQHQKDTASFLPYTKEVFVLTSKAQARQQQRYGPQTTL